MAALKLATEFLRAGGTFVTKIFRSNDYNSLLWVLQKLFRRVSATKPTASRNESAEIFCVCEGYLAPHKLDPRMVDPRFVFKDVAQDDQAITIRAFEPKKKARKNRQGYSGESDVLIGDKRTVSEYVDCEDPIIFLYKFWVLTWDDEAKEKYWAHTSEEVRELMEDLKRIGKGEARLLLRWRTEMRRLYKLDEQHEDENAEDEQEQAPVTVDDELDALIKKMDAKEKRKVRKQREAHKRALDRANRGIVRKGDVIDEVRDEDLFDLEALWKSAGGGGGGGDDDEEDGLEGNPSAYDEETFQELMERYLEEGHKNSKRQKIKVKGGFGVTLDDEEQGMHLPEGKPLVQDTWFDQNLFDGVVDVDDEEEDDDGEGAKVRPRQHESVTKKRRKASAEEYGGDIDHGGKEQEEDEEEEDEDDDDEIPDDDMVAIAEANDPAVRAQRLQLLSMGRAVLNGETSFKEMVDDSFNKWTPVVDLDSLPEWFTDNDRDQWKPHGPAVQEKVTAEDRARVAALADRPIKKVAEARARRKKKMADKLKHVSTKATTIAQNSEMTPAQRQKMISKLYKGVAPKERGKTYMVGKKHETLSKKRVVKGKTKGAVKMVDGRMKRDKMGQKKLNRPKSSGPKRKRG